MAEPTKETLEDEGYVIEFDDAVCAVLDAADSNTREEIYRLRDILRSTTLELRTCLVAIKNTTKNKDIIKKFEESISDFCGLREAALERIALFAMFLRDENYGQAHGTFKELQEFFKRTESVAKTVSNIHNCIGERNK